MKLIDADNLKYQMFKGGYKGKWTKEEILNIIDNQPTSYDADKVVEQLENLSVECVVYSQIRDIVFTENAIEIVKGGGKDE